MTQIESDEEREKRLRYYPPVGTERVESRIYLEDYFDKESIETDQLLYLAMKDRPVSFFGINVSDKSTNKKENLLIFWKHLTDFVTGCKKNRFHRLQHMIKNIPSIICVKNGWRNLKLCCKKAGIQKKGMKY